MKNYDVLLIGEALVDFVPEEEQIPGTFRSLAGGAPNNVACGLARLGADVALLARVGDDALGRYVIHTARGCGVDTHYIQIDPHRFTTVTVVMPKSEDMLRYAIYREGSADGALTYEEIPQELFTQSKLLHYGSLSMAGEPSRSTTRKAIEEARKNGMITSLDVNLRPNAWTSQQEMKDQSLWLIQASDIIKLTKEEAAVLGIELERMAKEQNKVIVMTDGSDTAAIYTKDITVTQMPKHVEALDVTGAGDSFMSAFLYFYVKHKKAMKPDEFYQKAMHFAICASAISVQRYGAIDSLPTLKEIEETWEGKWKL